MNQLFTAACLGIASLALWACSANPTAPLPSLLSWQPVEVDYNARTAAAVWRAPLELEFEAREGASIERFIKVEVAWVDLSGAEVRELTGDERWAPWALTTDRDSSQAALAALEDALIACQTLTLWEGQQGYVTITNQTAFIERFDIEREGSAAVVADPVIGIVHDGLLLNVRGHTVGDEVQLDVLVEQHDLQRPFPAVEVELPGALLPVTIQQPVGSARYLDLDLWLAPNRSAVFALPVSGDPSRARVGFLSAASFTPPELDPQSDQAQSAVD